VAGDHIQANAALYLPVAEVDLRDVFPGAQLAGGLFARGSAFRVPFKDGSVRFNIMPAAQVARHLAEFVAYIESLEESEAAKETAARAVEATKTVLGLQTDLEFEGNEELGDLLEKINEHYQGCVFMFDSVLHGGEVLVGPLKEAAT
jgi:hypothetical protein